MATKDWKKGKYKNHYFNKISKEKISIVFDYIGHEDKWLVVITDNYEDVINERDFKTKSQALKFAKHYMKMH